MSEKTSHKKERRRSPSSSSSSSTYSSSSSHSSEELKRKDEDKSKEKLRPTNPPSNVNKMRLDIGYKIQQEELSDSEESEGNSTPLGIHSKSSDILKYSTITEIKTNRSKSHERTKYRSPSIDKRREISQSKDLRKDRSQSKDARQENDAKVSSKYDYLKRIDCKDHSKNKERNRERSRSRDKKKRNSRSRERKLTRSRSRDKKKERSRSKEKRRDRSKSSDKIGDLSRMKKKKRDRSRSREKRREKLYRESRSPSYYKESSKSHSKRGRSREKSSKRSRSRSRSRSRPRKRTRSRSRSFERTKRTYDKKNKLSILEKLGIELKVPEGHVIGEPGENSSGFSIPSYYNPAGVNPLKYAQQMQKRRLIWGSKKQEGENSIEKKEEVTVVKPESSGPESVWKGTTFSQDQDGICAREIELVQVSTGKPATEKKCNVAIDDRFKLKVPVTDQYMIWEVIFNCSLPNCPPDFELNDIDFIYSVTLDSMEEILPSLNNWDHKKANALINVISELRSAYLKYQVEKLGIINNRCAYEYSSLINESKMPAEEVEVLIDSNTVHFLIKLDVDLTHFFPSAVFEDYVAVLAMKYGTLGSVRSATLITSPRVVQLIGTDFEIQRNIKSDENLSEYSEDIKSSIENQVLTIIQKRQSMRKQFIFEFLKHLGHSLISYDALEYSSACFLLGADGFQCILEVSLPSMFPNQKPSYRFLSVYLTQGNGQPFTQVFSLPFSDSWDIPTMVDQALTRIMDKQIQVFRSSNIKTFKLPK